VGTSRHAPGNRAALEAVMFDWLPWVARRCKALGIRLELWPHVREIAAPVQSEAWDRITDELARYGTARDAAERTAAERLGLELEMLRSRRRRAREAARAAAIGALPKE
jgi:hypothetical protein